MANYTIDQLCEKGPYFAMAMLLRCLKHGESFITYGAIKEELEHQLDIDKIFPTQIGYVAGSLMNKILELDPKAPLINALITRPDGIPGKGVGEYFAVKYKNNKYVNWDKVSKKEKMLIVEKERKEVFCYNSWEKLNKKLFIQKPQIKLRKQRRSEIDGFSANGMNNGGPAESKEHKKLKEWVANNPQKVGINKLFGKGYTEAELLSGDTIDVLFSYGNKYVIVEVKSCHSNDNDFRRGIYQCVKYMKVKEAEHFPNNVLVRSLLITERDLNAELKTRACLLKVGFKCIYINNKINLSN